MAAPIDRIGSSIEAPSRIAIEGTVMAKKKNAALHSKSTAGDSGKWSAAVLRKSDAMDLEKGVFKLRTPEAVARSMSWNKPNKSCDCFLGGLPGSDLPQPLMDVK